MVFVMLNPSTADAEVDDPTIRRCISFAKREGCGRMSVLNLFALRSTDPKELKKHPKPTGPDNDEYIQAFLNMGRMFPDKYIFVAAWGSHGVYKDRDYQVRLMFRNAAVLLHCLGKTKSGHPRHPLYVKGDTPLEYM